MTGKSPQDQDDRDQTIVPVRRHTAAEPAPVAARPPRRRAPVFTMLAAIVGLAGVVFVFAYLPRWIARPEPEPEPAVVPVAEQPAEPVPVLSEEETARLKEQAEDLLARLLEQRQSLDLLSAASWGDTSWSSYTNAARLADDAFLAENFPESVRQYESALDIGETLLARSANIVAEALAAGAAAIESGNAELAAEQYALVLGIQPDNATALRGQARAAALPDVLAAMSRGDAADIAGDLEQAAAAYRDALAIDADWEPARTALDSVGARIAAARFDQLLDKAYAELAAGENEDAAGTFNQALAIRADSAAARDGLAQAEQNQLLDTVAVADLRGRASERTERWDQAIERYREALAADPTLTFAIEGLERAQRRADLAAKMQAMIDAPRRLLADEPLENARVLLDEARAIPEPGARHLGQIEQLSRLVVLASTPIPITLASDGMTEVTVYRLGDLGTFTQKEVALRPGDYIAVGRRRGFRDVRENFSVLPGVSTTPVEIVCTEPI
jgi:tetratricopeptide (TPR) repeat protein